MTAQFLSSLGDYSNLGIAAAFDEAYAGIEGEGHTVYLELDSHFDDYMTESVNGGGYFEYIKWSDLAEGFRDYLDSIGV